MADGLRGHRRGCPVVGVLVSVRPVWLTRAQRDRLGSCFEHMIAGEVQAAWDAAPADPVEDVKQALARMLMASNPDLTAKAVLEALGHPDD